MRKKLRLLIVFTVLALVAAACTGGKENKFRDWDYATGTEWERATVPPGEHG